MTALENVVVATDARHKTSVPGALVRTPRHRREEKTAIERAAALLHFVGIAHRGEEKAKNLPYGDQRRLEIARALLHRPRVYLYDEPWTGLDQSSSGLLTSIFEDARRDGATVLFSTHEFERSLTAANRAIILRGGRLVYDGMRDEWRDVAGFSEVYLAALAAQPRADAPSRDSSKVGARGGGDA
jgi:branched-chain amino acid transport system ATP-binding protein